MTTAQVLIDRAFREGNLTPVGSAPSADEQTEGLSRLNSMIGSLLGFELGELVTEWQVPPRSTAPVLSRYPLAPRSEKLPDDVWPYPPPNVQISTKLAAVTTIYLYPAPDDGARIKLADAGSTANLTIDANGRTIEGAATLSLDPVVSAPREWFYRADKSDWIRLKTLAIGDESPFPPEFDDLFTTGLAIRLMPANGKEPLGITFNTYRNMLRKFRARYKQSRRMPADYSLAMQTAQTYPSGSLGGRDLLK